MFRIQARQERTALISWTIAVFLYFLLIGLSYGTIQGNADYDQIWQDMPDAVRELFGGAQSITTVDGYMESQATSYLPILVGIYGVAAATKRTAGAEESGLLDHLLARPVARLTYLGTLAGVLAINAIAITASAWLGATIGMAASGVSGNDLLRLTAMFIDIIPISLSLAAVGLLAGAWSHRRGPALGVSLVVVVGTFAFQIIAQLVDWLSWTTWITPFGLWGRSDAFHGDLEPVYYLYSATAVVGSGALAAWRFKRKDLYA